ncbi:MAG: hypothetical protein Q4G70_09375 [Pseudomonadota bacterium]|nr:hypothetical protein [Pseudomonadota bacterium]
MKLQRIQDMLQAIQFVDDEVDQDDVASALDAIRALPEPRATLPLLFDWFERHAECHVGSPGAFVHFIEEALDYNELLLTSLQRKPTDITVWMVNRLANGTDDPSDIQRWTAALQAAACHPLADEACREAALDFLDFQQRRSRELGR